MSFPPSGATYHGWLFIATHMSRLVSYPVMVKWRQLTVPACMSYSANGTFITLL